MIPSSTQKDSHMENGAKADAPFVPEIITCPKCGQKAVAFICDRKGCPVNGGAVYD
jgi:DNA-directed RNA polymerase subunit M/transcription elongation factor TFIIS